MSIYDIPSAEGSVHSSIGPIWRWPATVDDELPYYFRCDALSYGSLSTKPVIWIFDSENQIHSFRLSESGHPVEDHHIYLLEYIGSPAIDSSRAIWIHRSRPNLSAAKIYTISLQHPPTQESFSLCLEEGTEGHFLGTYAFDELSGRVSLIVEELSGQRYVYISSIARLVEYPIQ